MRNGNQQTKKYEDSRDVERQERKTIESLEVKWNEIRTIVKSNRNDRKRKRKKGREREMLIDRQIERKEARNYRVKYKTTMNHIG